MANSYDVLKDFDGGTDSYVSSSSYWVIAVFRLKYPTTYRRNKFDFTFTQGNVPEGVQIFNKPLILSDECPQLTVTSSKTSHTTTLQAVLYPTEDFLQKIFPGDYVFAWMMNNKERHDSVIERLGKGEPCNSFLDGLKFFGKVESIRKQISQNPDGHKMSRYTFSGVGFGEFDNQIFYDPYLAERTPEIGTYFGRLGAELNSLIHTNGQGISVNLAIPFFVDILMGKGLPSNLSRGNTDSRLRATAGLEGEFSYILPMAVGSVFDKTISSKSGGVMAFADILELVYGIQKYDDNSADSVVFGDSELTSGRIFTPNGTGTISSRRFTGTEMLGTFTPDIPQFTNTSVWNILRQYLNPAVNELYTTLRVNPSGRIVPTLVLRQHPYTTDRYGGDLPVTKFSNLPRWKIPEVLIKTVDLGRSDALRINFVHIYGTSQATGVRGPTEQIVENPPFRDDADIARSGFRPYMQTVPCSISDTRTTGAGGVGQPTKWMEIVSDFTMGQHLTMTGNLHTFGIQAPICIGDNVEYDGVLLHIEMITHTCSINLEGKKEFSTALQLSHGVSSGQPDSDFQIYANVDGTQSQTTNDAQTTSDGFSQPDSGSYYEKDGATPNPQKSRLDGLNISGDGIEEGGLS